MKVLQVLFTIIWAFLGYALFMPVLSFGFGGGVYMYVIAYFGVMAALSFFDDNNVLGGVFATLAALLLIIFVGTGFFNSSLFRASQYQSLIGSVQKEEFVANVAPVEPSQMILVDEPIAQRLGEKVLGDDPGLGSKCELGGFNLQKVQGNLYWIAPLLHSGPFKWWANDGTPGYVVVSATNEKDVRLVREVNGKPIKLVYQPNAYFGQDLERHVYMSGYMGKGLTDYTFEVDDQWKPYYTITTYDSKIGFSGDDATGVVVVDPETGTMNWYDVASVPEWSDRIQPEAFVSNQVGDWGDLVHGWWNPSDKDKLTTVSDHSIVLGSDGRMYYYIGLQSVGADNGTVGFMMVDCRTKRAVWIHQSGATEDAARGSANGALQAQRLQGGEGITYNIHGQATYEFLMKDEAGLMKAIALVSVRNYEDVAIGPDRLTAIRNYAMIVGKNRGNATSNAVDLKINIKSSVITRISSEVTGGNTIYYFMIDGEKNQLFGNSGLSTELCLTKAGDKVVVGFYPGDGDIQVQSFDNLNIGFTKSQSQKTVEAKNDSIQVQQLQQQQIKVADKKWDDLSPAEKQKALENL